MDYTPLWLPRWLSGKEAACQWRRHKFDPWVRKIPWKKKWQPTPTFLPGKSHEQRSLAGYSPWSCKEQAIVHGVAKSQTRLSYWGYTYILCHFIQGIWGLWYLWGFWRQYQSIPRDGLLACSPTKLGMWKVAHKKREFSWPLLLLLLFFQKAHFQNWLRHLVYYFTYTLITPLLIISIMILIRILS